MFCLGRHNLHGLLKATFTLTFMMCTTSGRDRCVPDRGTRTADFQDLTTMFSRAPRTLYHSLQIIHRRPQSVLSQIEPGQINS